MMDRDRMVAWLFDARLEIDEHEKKLDQSQQKAIWLLRKVWECDFNVSIGSIVTDTSGNQYLVTGIGYNNKIDLNKSISDQISERPLVSVRMILPDGVSNEIWLEDWKLLDE